MDNPELIRAFKLEKHLQHYRMIYWQAWDELSQCRALALGAQELEEYLYGKSSSR